LSRGGNSAVNVTGIRLRDAGDLVTGCGVESRKGFAGFAFNPLVVD
jgi:hypothetical protein